MHTKHRHLVYKHLDIKDIDSFKLVPQPDRWLVFKYLDTKNLEAFKLVPMEDKKKIFGELDKDAKNIEILS